MSDSCFSKILVWGTLTKAQWQKVRKACKYFADGSEPNFDSASGAASFESEYSSGIQEALSRLEHIKGVNYLATCEPIDGCSATVSWWDGKRGGGSSSMGSDRAAVDTCDVRNLVRMFRGLKPEDMPLILAKKDGLGWGMEEACRAILGGQDFLEWLEGWLDERTEIEPGKLTVDGKEDEDILEA